MTGSYVARMLEKADLFLYLTCFEARPLLRSGRNVAIDRLFVVISNLNKEFTLIDRDFSFIRSRASHSPKLTLEVLRKHVIID
jgi:hypothetical protein